MTIAVETMDGHQYQVTRDDAGNIVAQVGMDPPPVLPALPIRAKAQALIAALKAGTATPLQQQQALALCLALLMNLSDI